MSTVGLCASGKLLESRRSSDVPHLRGPCRLSDCDDDDDLK